MHAKKFNFLFLSILLVLNLSCKKNSSQNTEKIFSFNLPSEFDSFDPLLTKGSAKSYVLFNLHRGLYYYDKNNKLHEHGGRCSANIDHTEFDCVLNPLKWSNGDPILAQDYINTFETIKILNEDSLTSIKHIKNVVSKHPKKLKFILKSPRKEFLHNLTHINLTPRKEKKTYQNPLAQVFSGPYILSKKHKTHVILTNNKYYDDHKRPMVKAIFIDEPAAALNLYDSGELSFLRYLETTNIKKYSETLYLVPQIRLDGLFISPKININTRQALATSLDFEKLTKIFHSKSLAGCVPVPDNLFKKLPCIKENKNISPIKYKEKLNLDIPSMSTGDHLQFAQWATHSWKNKLGIDVQINSHEIKTFYAGVKKNKYLLYRKAIPVQEINCPYLIENMMPEINAPYVRLNLSNCDTFFNQILRLYQWVPLGMPWFAHLHAKDYDGYYINLIGQMGLENLKVKDNEKK